MSAAKCTCRRKVTHIIFDMDGTLVDTESVYEELYGKLIGKFDKTITKSLKLKYLGLPVESAIKTLIDELQLPTTTEVLYKEYEELHDEMFGKLKLMEGAERLMRHLQRHNISMAIATNSDHESAQMKLVQFPEMSKMIHHVVTASDVVNGKPAPDIYLAAASKFPNPPKPEDCLAFEDSMNGVKSAIAAGMQCIHIPEANLPQNNETLATLVLPCLIDFQPEMFGLPPFDK